MKKRVLLFIAISLAILPYSFASIFEDSLELGESYQYVFEDIFLNISFEEYDAATDSAKFEIQGNTLTLPIYEPIALDKMTIYFTGIEGTKLSNLKANYLIVNTSLKCHYECQKDFFSKIVSFFNISVCKKEICAYDCDKYHKFKCIDNEMWLVDSCNNKIKKDRSVCKKAKGNIKGCISEASCETGNCISGKCTDEQYVEGNNVCTLPYEPCNSPDCSCNNIIAEPTLSNYPLVLIHGFISNPDTFSKLKNKLIKDDYYIDGGNPLEECKLFSNIKPVYSISYYEDPKDEYLYGYFFEESTEEKTPEQILSETIEAIKRCTLSKKVDVIAHSNGGIIIREYLLHEDNQKNINNLILLGTANHGQIYGDQWIDVAPGLKKFLGDRKEFIKTCKEKGVMPFLFLMVRNKDITDECDRFDEGAFLNNLNNIDETPGKINYYTIAGLSDENGDGMVHVGSVKLNGSINRVVSCGHHELKDPQKCPHSYNFILKALNKKEIKKNFIDKILSFLKR